jgi:endogenous inhibitor of DNA gyrase (YacG/DUF329 family)
MNSSKNDPVLACPTCRSSGRWFSAAFGPFCSDRCRLIDLGRWFNEENRISRPLGTRDMERSYSNLPNPSLITEAELLGNE